MVAIIIWFLCVWGSAALFFGIGVYAERRKKPMWFWAGSDPDKIKVTDMEAHNKAHGVMWKKYSTWFWVAGITYLFSEVIALVILVLSCTVGFILLYRDYKRIERDYIVN